MEKLFFNKSKINNRLFVVLKKKRIILVRFQDLNSRVIKGLLLYFQFWSFIFFLVKEIGVQDLEYIFFQLENGIH